MHYVNYYLRLYDVQRMLFSIDFGRTTNEKEKSRY